MVADVDHTLDRVSTARTVLAEHAATTEEQGAPTVESLAAVREAGALALTTPGRFDGSDADDRTIVAVLAELAAGCPSTAWICAVSATLKATVTDGMSRDAQEAFYADPDVLLCGTTTPSGRAHRVPGGFRITGRWGPAVGCLDAPWAVVGLTTGDAALLPVADLAIDHTGRDDAGLRGTGGHTLVADDVFVASSFVLAPRPSARTALHLAAPVLGTARGALDHVASMTATARSFPQSAYRRRAGSAHAQRSFDDARRLVETAERRLMHVADGLGTMGLELPRMRVATAVGECHRATSTLLELQDTAFVVGESNLTRCWRDVSVGALRALDAP